MLFDDDDDICEEIYSILESAENGDESSMRDAIRKSLELLRSREEFFGEDEEDEEEDDEDEECDDDDEPEREPEEEALWR